ncbi:LacI family DNA-binding transcriptional regulator [Streptomyces hygroscopicus]|uniref:LacI family DNA-binding transcriptional regulator n=1 Tax=Streptomyces hygroscopicus TaxID=1912 RepID=UPI003627E910
MKQLAELAGLDISTVSRALRGDSRRVAASTIERVQALARATGYVPDPVASSLRSGRSRLLGVVVPILTDIVMGILVTAIEEASRELGYLSTVVATHGDPAVRSGAVSLLLKRKVDGLVLCDSEMGHEVPAQLKSSGVPFVFAMRRCDGEVSVTADDQRGGALVAEHFIATGHRQVAVVPGPANARTAVDRMTGFLDVMAEHPEVQVAPSPTGGGFGVEDGYRFVTALLARKARPTALFCTNDHTAIGAARALADLGLRVGHDVALVGYNDIPQAAYLETPLSSVRTDLNLMGSTAAQRLVSLVDGEDAAGMTIEPTLVVRASSSVPAVIS